MTEAEELVSRFKIVCRRCGSDNISLEIERGIRYGSDAHDPCYINICCEVCKDNDFALDL